LSFFVKEESKIKKDNEDKEDRKGRPEVSWQEQLA
jgi:hypothetical protein